MRILYIHQYFNFPFEPGGTRSYWIVKEMQKRNHQVKVITSTYNKSIKPGRYIIDDIEIEYLPVSYDQKLSNFKKIKAFLKFSLLTLKQTLKIKNLDLIYCTSTPLTIGIPGVILKKINPKTKFVFEVRDLWPRVPIELGEIRNPVIRLVSLKLEKIIYQTADLIIALSPGMEKGVKEVYFKTKTILAPNMSKKDLFHPRPIKQELIRFYNLGKNSFKVIYFGAMGPTNNIAYAIKAAEILQTRNVEFIFIGHGKDVQIVKKCNLQNVHYLGHLPMNQTSELVNLCDLSLVLFANFPILSTNSPNKFFDSLSAGKPIIVNSDGWTKDIVEEYKCGIFVDPSNPEELVDGILKFKENPKLIDTYSQEARRLALNKYDKEIITKDILKSIEKL